MEIGSQTPFIFQSRAPNILQFSFELLGGLELLLDYSPIDNLRHLFRAILNSVLEDTLTKSSKPPNNLSENLKMLGGLELLVSVSSNTLFNIALNKCCKLPMDE